ncbi:MAG: hypothetical protein KJ072_12385 [Verrucomicrobia bacterium]|nr:hypothetical protein [Verrucomicrobiota bacterium]
MENPTAIVRNTGHGLTHVSGSWLGLIAAVFLLAGGSTVPAQTISDDFNDGNDVDWLHMDLTKLPPPYTLPDAYVSYSFPDDGAGGKAYRIWAKAPPPEYGANFGPARTYSYRSPNFGRMRVSVDVLDWDTTANQVFGLVVRGGQIGLGETDGYVVNYWGNGQVFQINTVVNEEDDAWIADCEVPLHPSQGPYRWVFSADGLYFVGQIFTMADLNNPIAGVLVADDNRFPSGQVGVFVFDYNSAATDYTDVYATFDNFQANSPAAGTMRPLVTELTPRPGSALVSSSPPLIRVGIADMDVYTDSSSFRLWTNGVEVPKASLQMDPFVYGGIGRLTQLAGATMEYQTTAPVRPGVTYTVRVTWSDMNGQANTNEWTYAGPIQLPASGALPLDAGEERGFNIRLVQTLEGQPLANSLLRAEDQLAVPPRIPIQFETAAGTTATVINYSQNPPPSDDGYFPDDARYPGLDVTGNTDDFALEARFYLELTPGYYKFGIRSDDGFQLSTGPSMAEVTSIVLAEALSSTYNDTFEFGVETEGLYPFRLVHFERGGDAYVELFQVSLDDPEDRMLINDLSDPNAIKAWRTVTLPPQIVVESATTLAGGGFASDASAVIDTANQRITISKAGEVRFYRIQAATALTIQTIEISGNNVILTY